MAPLRRQEATLRLLRAGSRLVGLYPGMEPAWSRLAAITKLGAEGSQPVPAELLPMGSRVLAQGYLNRVAMPLLDGWLLPRWMREQSDPASPCFVPRSVHNLFINQTRRNWTALGLPGSEHKVESTVDPCGLLTPVPGGPSLDWWAAVDGSDLGTMSPSTHGAPQQRLQGGLPVVATAFEAGGLRVSSEAWMLALPEHDWVAMQVVLFNIADLPLRGTFRFALRPYNPEGIAPTYRLEFDGHKVWVDGKPGPVTWPRPRSYRFSTLAGGDLFNPAVEGTTQNVHDPHGFANGVIEYRFYIEPWEEAEYLAFMPVSRSVERYPNSERSIFRAAYRGPETPADKHLPHPQAYSRAKAASGLEWRTLLGEGMKVSLPDRALQESWEASRLHLLALHDGGTITPGPDLYHSYWVRDAALMIYALTSHGYTEAARQLLAGMAAYEERDGAIISQSSEWDGTGQVLWAIGRHLALHPHAYLQETLTPLVERGANWIVNTLRGHSGLMPPGISSEHFGPPDRYYWDNLWSLAGLEAAAALLGHGWIREAARILRAELLKLFAADFDRFGSLCGAPGRAPDLSVTGTLAAWYPLALLPESSPYLAPTLERLRKLFYRGALFVNTGHSGWGTYINMRIAGCYLLSEPAKGWELLLWLLRHASPTYNWPEAIHPVSGGGSTGDGHHGWASAKWLLLVRSLLFREYIGGVRIAGWLPPAWFTGEGAVEVCDAPTSYGLLSYRLEWDGSHQLQLTLPDAGRVYPVVWTPPVPVVSVEIDAKPVECSRELVIPAGVSRVRARTERQ